MSKSVLALLLLYLGCGCHQAPDIAEINEPRDTVFDGYVNDSYTDSVRSFNTYIDFTNSQDTDLVSDYREYGRLASILYDTHVSLGRPNSAQVYKNLQNLYILVVHSDKDFLDNYAWGDIQAYSTTNADFRSKYIPGYWTIVVQDENFNKPRTIIHEMLHIVSVAETGSNDGEHENPEIWDESNPNRLFSLILSAYGSENI